MTCSIRDRRWLTASTASRTSACTRSEAARAVRLEPSRPLPPRRSELVVEHDQGDHVRPVVAVDQGLADQRVLLEQPLDVGRGQVLAAGGDDQLFLAVDDPEVAIVVELPVAGVQPAVGVDQLGRRLRLPEVAGGVDRPPDQHLAVAGEADLDPVQGRADGAELQLAGPVAGRGRGRRSCRRARPPAGRGRRRTRPRPRPGRGSAGGEHAAVQADGVPDLGQHQPLEQGVPGPQPERHRLAAGCGGRPRGRSRPPAGRSCACARSPRRPAWPGCRP